jgi:hypothetical protein
VTMRRVIAPRERLLGKTETNMADSSVVGRG